MLVPMLYTYIINICLFTICMSLLFVSKFNILLSIISTLNGNNNVLYVLCILCLYTYRYFYYSY